MIWASCERRSSSQKIAGDPVARARDTASFTQSRMAMSLVCVPRQMSPLPTSCDMRTSPAAFSTSTRPAAAISNVLSWLPYSSAACAMRPTLGTVPMVAGSSGPLAITSSMVAWYTPAYDESGMTAMVSSSPPSTPQSLPPLRTRAGMEASTITSDGTCRLVMPLSLLV